MPQHFGERFFLYFCAVISNELEYRIRQCFKYSPTPEQVQAIKEMYNVEGFPTKVIIDPEGKLVKVVVGEDPAFYPFLDELFAKK